MWDIRQSTRSGLGLTICAILVIVQAGCISIGWKRPVDVLVLDAETNQPISGATVLVNPVIMSMFAGYVPTPERGTTNASGITTIPVANVTQGWNVDADGYIAAFGTSGRCRVPESFRAIDEHRGEREQAVVKLFRGPEPTVTLIVPDGYRGRVMVEVVPQASTVEASRAGQSPLREFTFFASPNGYVRIDAPPILLANFVHNEPKDWQDRIVVREASGRTFRDWNKPLDDEELREEERRFQAGEPLFPQPMLRPIAARDLPDGGGQHLFYLGDGVSADTYRARLGESEQREAQVASVFAQAVAESPAPAIKNASLAPPPGASQN